MLTRCKNYQYNTKLLQDSRPNDAEPPTGRKRTYLYRVVQKVVPRF